MGESWAKQILGDVLVLEYGKALPERSRDGLGYPVMGSNGIVGLHSKALVKGPGIVVGRKGTAGSVTWVPTDFSPIDTTYWVRVLGDSLTLEFAYWLLLSARLPDVCAQTGVPGLNRDRAYELPIQIPPLKVQRRIVDLLGHIDAHASTLRAELAASEQVRMSLVDEHLRLARSGATGGDATIKVLGDLIGEEGSLLTGPFGTALKASEYVETGVPVVSVGEIVGGRIRVHPSTPRVGEATLSRLPRYRLELGDVVFARKGAVERTALITPTERGFFLGSDGIRLRLPPHVNAEYVALQLSSARSKRWLIQHAGGTTMPSMNQETIMRIPIVMPTPTAQKHALDQVRAWDDLGTRMVSEIIALEVVRHAMLRQLLTKSREISERYDAILEGVA